MGADDEFRKVAEDVRELARALRSELRAAKWETKDAARQARREWRAYYRSGAWRGSPYGWDHRSWQQGTTAPGAPTDAPPGSGPPPPPPPPPPPGRTGSPANEWARWASQAIPHPPPTWQTPRRQAAPAPPVRAPRPPKPARPKAPPVRHRRDGSTLVSLLLVIIGLAWLGAATGVFTVSLEAVLAAILAILGAVMVVTARTDWSLSRRHWPVWLGFALLLVLMVSVSGPSVRGSFTSFHMGPVAQAPVSWASGSASNFAGPVDVDLTSLKPPDGAHDITLRVHDVFGPITVTVPQAPEGYRIEIDARTSFGPVTVLGHQSAGIGSHQSAVVPGAGPTLHLVVGDAFGPAVVQLPGAPTGSTSVSPAPTVPPVPTPPGP